MSHRAPFVFGFLTAFILISGCGTSDRAKRGPTEAGAGGSAGASSGGGSTSTGTGGSGSGGRTASSGGSAGTTSDGGAGGADASTGTGGAMADAAVEASDAATDVDGGTFAGGATAAGGASSNGGSGGSAGTGGVGTGGTLGTGGSSSSGGSTGSGGTLGTGGTSVGGAGTGGTSTDAQCPVVEPANQSSCTSVTSGTYCTYGGDSCLCEHPSPGSGTWTCLPKDASCDTTPPADGASCTGKSGTDCLYPNLECVCGDDAQTWTCTAAQDPSCPPGPTWPSGACTGSLYCNYAYIDCFCSGSSWFCLG